MASGARLVKLARVEQAAQMVGGDARPRMVDHFPRLHVLEPLRIVAAPRAPAEPVRELPAHAVEGAAHVAPASVDGWAAVPLAAFFVAHSVAKVLRACHDGTAN
eukprot:2785486-Prymnesium_polylepis.1